MRINPTQFTTLTLLSACLAANAWAADIQTIEAPQIPLATVTYLSGKTSDLTVGYSSGAYHRPGDDESIVYSISDRGPNIHCDEAKELTGSDTAAMCGGDPDGKIFPDPSFVPSIYKFKIANGKATVEQTIPLKGRDGALLSGLSIPLTKNPTEHAFDANGKPLKQTPNGFDSEALVQLKDGGFWISDEYGASIAHLGPDGTVLERFVPKGIEGDFKDADYDTKGTLPAIIAKRKLNRGIESLAISPDEKTLYFALQSPLANPDKAAAKHSRIVRLFKFDIASQSVTGEYAYQIDTPDTFKADTAKKKRKQGDVKISEMAAIGQDTLLVLERISKTTKLYRVNLTDAATIPATFDDPATSPTLEQLKGKDLDAAAVKPLAKTLVFNTDTVKNPPSKIEGVAVINPTTLIMMTDNDFGIDGAKCHIVKVTLDTPMYSGK